MQGKLNYSWMNEIIFFLFHILTNCFPQLFVLRVKT